jgi:lycopene cyclase domain-containing protein
VTYLEFHAALIAPPLVVLGVAAWRAHRALGPRAAWAIWAVPLIALVYTTPWDNYLVRTGVWYYGIDRVVGTIGYVPIEEYLFFLLQPLLAGALLYVLLARALTRRGPATIPAHAGRVRIIGTTLWLALGIAGLVLLRADATTYLGLILAWFAPVIAAMWLFQGHSMWRVRRAAIPAIVILTVYLWMADRLALAEGIWAISDRYTIGVAPLGLPIEEATFFLVTTVLSVCGVLLFLLPRLPELRANS